MEISERRNPHDLASADMNGDKVFSLEDLIRELRKAFEGNKVDVDHVQHLMAAYKSNAQDWRKYAKFDRHRYTRNLVDEGNGKFNLLVLCWGEGHGSAIHDHSEAHCIMKILQGELCETRYSWPKESKIPQEMEETTSHIMLTNGVCYMHDRIGLHRVENLSTVNTAVSLHLYSPPFSTCSVFNKQTGQKTVSKVTFWSKYGDHRNREVQDSRMPEDN